MSTYEIDPFDIVSGKVVQNHIGTFWFKEPGNNIDEDGWPIYENLHRDGDLPAAICPWGVMEWFKDGKRHRENGPARLEGDYGKSWFYNGKCLKEEFIDFTSGVTKTIKYDHTTHMFYSV